MEKLKLGEWGERIKTGGVQMGRRVSGKMKEILHGQTPEGKMVDEATSDHLQEPDWFLNLRICSLLASEEFSGQEVVRAIKKKIVGRNQMSQRLSLEILEVCAMNCEKIFSEIASEKVLEEMVRLIDNLQTHYGTRQRALQLIQAWGDSPDLGYLPVFHQTYMSLKTRGARFPVQEDASPTEGALPVMDLIADQSHASLRPRFPAAGIDQQVAGQDVMVNGSVILSTEQRKEIIEMARNGRELLSAMLESKSEGIPSNDNPIISVADNCRRSQAALQRMIESTSEDENLLFDALNLHEELQRVLTKYEESKVVKAEPELSEPNHGSNDELPVSTVVGAAEKSEHVGVSRQVSSG